MTDVRVIRSAYHDNAVQPAVFDMMAAFCSDSSLRQARVLIKPNLLLAATPKRAVTTHPLIVRAVARYVIDRGGSVQISDSPAVGSFKKLLKTGGYLAALEGLPVVLKPFAESVAVDVGAPFGRIDIARAAMEADVVINLAKLKTHSQMTMTLGVKNLFGCVVGLKKPEWHLRCGMDREMFAALLVQIHRAVNPALTLVDGILALEGQGPGKSGIPRPLGLLVGSRCAFTADRAICTLLGLPPAELPTVAAAGRMGLGTGPVNISGTFDIINDFQFPAPEPIVSGPGLLQRQMRKHILQRPVADRHRCKMCGDCQRYCPAGAIDCSADRPDFNYDRCIRCYCCVEVCPHGAMFTARPPAGRLLLQAAGLWQRLGAGRRRAPGGID